MDYIYICKIKVIGMPFAVLTEELAIEWEAKDPESNYYEKVPVVRAIT